MRVNMYQNGGAGAQDLANPQGVATGPIVLTRDATLPMEAVAKQYVDTAVTTLSASNITSGTLSPAFLPAYTGDATSVAGTATFTLAATGVTPGRYTKFTVDAKGRVTSGSNIVEADLPAMSWSDIALDKPTTLAGFGITDALAITGGTLTQNLILSGAPTLSTHIASKGYLDSVVAGGAAVQTPTGNIVQLLTGADRTGFLTCNGASISKTTYASLYAVVGDAYKSTALNGDERPWLFQAPIGRSATALSASIGIVDTTNRSHDRPPHYAFVTKNKIFVGFVYQTNIYYPSFATQYVSHVQYNLDSNGVIINVDVAPGVQILPAATRGGNYAITFKTSNKVWFAVAGATGDANAFRELYYCTIDSNGDPSAGVLHANIAYLNSNSRVVRVGSKLYVFNSGLLGTAGGVPYGYVTLDDAGMLTTYTDVGVLPAPTISNAVADAFVYKNKLFVFTHKSGLDGAGNTNYVYTMYYCSIDADNNLSAWTQGPTLTRTGNPNGTYVGPTGVPVNGDIWDHGYYGDRGSFMTADNKVQLLMNKLGYNRAGEYQYSIIKLTTTELLTDANGVPTAWGTATDITGWMGYDAGPRVNLPNIGSLNHASGGGVGGVCTSSKIYFFNKWSKDATAGGPCLCYDVVNHSSGVNDYMPYFSTNFAPTPATHFRLPDLTPYDVTGTNHCIKT